MLRGGLTARISANTEYAKWLEYGTSKIAPRPFLKPAILKVGESGFVKRQIDKAWSNAIKEVYKR